MDAKSLRDRISELESERKSDNPIGKVGYLEAIIYSMPDIIFIVDNNGKYLDILTDKASLLYREASYLLGKRFRDVLPISVADITEAGINRVIENGESTTVEYMLNINDQEMWFEGRIASVAGSKEQFIFVVIDITERQQMNKMLENGRYKLHKAQEIAKLAYFELSIKTNEIHFSPELNVLLGLSSDLEVNRDMFFSLLDSIDKKNIIKGIEHEIYKTNRFVYEYKILLGNDEVRSHVIHCELYQTESSSVVFGIIQDVTDFRALEHDHSRSAMEKKAMLKAIPDMMFIQDGSGKFIDFHAPKTTVSNLFVNPDDFLGKKSTDVLPLDIAAENMSYIKKVLQTNQHVIHEYSLSISGRVSFYEARMVPSGHQSVLSIVREVTSRKKSEQELIKAKLIAEESDRLKSEFLANMSHEIRTPMNGVVGFAELLLQEDVPYDEKIEYFNIIEKNSYQLIQLIDDIIDVSKIEAKLLRLIYIDFNINDLLKYVAKIYQKEIDMSDKSIVLTVEYLKSEKQAWIRCDKTRLMQVLQNLLSNAVKFTEKGEIKVGLRNENSRLYFLIGDTGIGIPEMACNHIFERFRRLDNPADKLYRGTGLGLSVTQGLIELMGGQINVESEEGQGTTFTFDIPHAPAESISFPKEDNNSWDVFANKCVLIVEDEDTSYHYLASILKKNGVKVSRAKTGYQAIEIVKEEQIDLILMDIRLPELNGYDATRYIKIIDPNLPIIAQTAFALAEDEEKAKDAGCDDYVTKPISSELLLKKMKLLLSR